MITKKFGICVRTLLIINILFGFVLYSQSAYSDVTNKEKMSDEKNFQGKWIVRDVLDLAPILPIEEAMVNSLPGKVLEISDGLVSFVEYKCASPKLKFSSIQTASFFRDYKMDTPKNLPKFVKAFAIVCDGKDSYELSPLLIRRKSLLLIWRGALVELVRR